MPTERNRMVRERAYALWVESGHQDGKSDEHWLQAEQEVASMPAGKPMTAKAAKPKTEPAEPAPAKAPPKAPASRAKAADAKPGAAKMPAKRAAPKAAEAGATKH